MNDQLCLLHQHVDSNNITMLQSEAKTSIIEVTQLNEQVVT